MEAREEVSGSTEAGSSVPQSSPWATGAGCRPIAQPLLTHAGRRAASDPPSLKAASLTSTHIFLVRVCPLALLEVLCQGRQGPTLCRMQWAYLLAAAPAGGSRLLLPKVTACG